MTDKNWHKVSQEVTCALCDKVVKRNANNQKYCSVKCQQKAFVKEYQYRLKCEVCNEHFLSQHSTTPTCSKFCGHVLNMTNRQLYTDEEIIHLALLNPGYGFRAFCEKVKCSSNNNTPYELQRIPYIFEQCKKELKLDLHAHLNNPDYMETMYIDEWIAKGRPRAGTKHVGQQGNRMNQRKIMATYREYEKTKKYDGNNRRTHRKVKVFPEFNWGSIEERTPSSDNEEE